MSRIVLLLCAVATACASGAPRPISVRLGEDACAHCRMTIVSTATAAQIVAAGAEPVMFDELGCLSSYLASHEIGDAAIFVVEHRTGEWLDATRAIFTRTGQATPMGSGLLAHADAASRDADDAARNGTAVPAGEVLQPLGERR